MYPIELEIKGTTESNTSDSYLDLPLSIGEGRSTSYFHLWQTWRFNFYITNFPFLSSNIPASVAYAMQLSNKGYFKECLKSSLKKFYGRYGDLMKQYAVPLSRMLKIPFISYHNFWPSDLDLEVWPTFQNFNLGHNFWNVRDYAFIFHMCIPCDKTFHTIPLFLT